MARNLHYRGSNVKLARNLRKTMTPAERRLWYEFLRYQKPRFYRQRPIGNFIADFYCQQRKLIIELDGHSHFTEQGKAYDQERTAVLSGFDLQVIRFTNAEVMSNFEGVCEVIKQKLGNLSKTTVLQQT